MKNFTRKMLKISLLFTILAASAYIAQPLWFATMNKIQNVDNGEALLYICAAYIIGSLLILPVGLPLSFLAGIFWGTFKGGLLMNVLGTLTAAISFLIARQFAADFTDSLFNRFAMLNRFKNTVNRFDWQFIALMRINPVIPFSLSNYAFGLIPGLSFSCYLIATFAANFLPCFIYVGIGATLKTISLQNTQLHQIIIDVGVVLLLITTLVMIKMMKFNQLTENLQKGT